MKEVNFVKKNRIITALKNSLLIFIILLGISVVAFIIALITKSSIVFYLSFAFLVFSILFPVMLCKDYLRSHCPNCEEEMNGAHYQIDFDEAEEKFDSAGKSQGVTISCTVVALCPHCGDQVVFTYKGSGSNISKAKASCINYVKNLYKPKEK